MGVTLLLVSSRVLTSLIFLGLAACTTAEGGNRARPSVIAEPQSPSDVWKGVATDADEQRIARTGLAWQEALQEARRASPREVEAEGELLPAGVAVVRGNLVTQPRRADAAGPVALREERLL